MRKYFLLIIVIIIVSSVVVYFWLGRPANPPPATASNLNSENQVSAGLNIISSLPRNYPVSETLTLGTSRGAVTVKNFYKNVIGQEGDTVLIENAKDYRLTYNMSQSSFWIFILNGPVTAVLNAAESDLLKILNISQQEACLLNITWSAAPAADAKLAGETFPLSFCPPAVK